MSAKAKIAVKTGGKAAAAAKAATKSKPAAQKVIHGPVMKTIIQAGMASAVPPLGTMLGQVKRMKKSLLISKLSFIISFLRET